MPTVDGEEGGGFDGNTGADRFRHMNRDRYDWCRLGAVCRFQGGDLPLLAAARRSPERKLPFVLVLFGSCQRGGRGFESRLVLQVFQAPSRVCARGFVIPDADRSAVLNMSAIIQEEY